MWAVERKEAGPVKTLTEDNSKFPSVGSVFPEKEAGRGEPQTKTKVPVPLKMAAPQGQQYHWLHEAGGQELGGARRRAVPPPTASQVGGGKMAAAGEGGGVGAEADRELEELLESKNP